MRAAVRLGSLLFALLVGCGAPPAVAWPPPLPAAIELDEDEPRALAATPEPAADLGAELPPPPETEARDGDRIEVVEGDIGGIRYLEVVLGDATPDEPLPQIWIFHGRGDRARVPGGPFLGLPRAVRLFIPQAPQALGDGFSWFPWRVAEGRTAELAVSIVGTAARLAAMIRAFAEERPTVGRPIVTGFSQGGILSWALALRHPDVVSHALPNAGWVPPSLVPELGGGRAFPPIRSLHGSLDERIALGPTRELAERLRAGGLDVTLEGVPGVGHTMTEEMNARFREWLVEALGALGPAPPP